MSARVARRAASSGVCGSSPRKRDQLGVVEADRLLPEVAHLQQLAERLVERRGERRPRSRGRRGSAASAGRSPGASPRRARRPRASQWPRKWNTSKAPSRSSASTSRASVSARSGSRRRRGRRRRAGRDRRRSGGRRLVWSASPGALLGAAGPKKSPARRTSTLTPSASDALRRRRSISTRIAPLRVTGACGASSPIVGAGVGGEVVDVAGDHEPRAGRLGRGDGVRRSSAAPCPSSCDSRAGWRRGRSRCAPLAAATTLGAVHRVALDPLDRGARAELARRRPPGRGPGRGCVQPCLISACGGVARRTSRWRR